MSNLAVSSAGVDAIGLSVGRAVPAYERLAATGDIASAMALVRENPGKLAEVEQAFFARGDLSAVHRLSARDRDPDAGQATAAQNVTAVTPLTRTGFATADAAAKAALNEANPQSIKANLEYGGLIYKAADGTFGYTAPKAGTETGFDLSGVTIPSGTTLAGDYHTHADYSQFVGGRTVRTSDPARDDYNSDQFSIRDLQGIASDASGIPGYRGYLGTPSGVFRVFDPAANTNTVLQ